MAFTDIDNPELHFQTKLYTGSGGTQSITLDGSEDMQPDWVWHKYRGGTGGHNLFDSVRGATKRIRTNTNQAENTGADTLTSFDSDGFSLGADGTGDGVNISGYSNVAWCWKAGGSSSSNSNGSVTSTVSANTTAGFSICKFTYPGSGNFTFGHGLGVAPRMFIVKGFSNSSALANWQVHHGAIGNTKNTQLNYTAASNSDANWWGSTSPTSTVCTVGADLVETSQDGIAYVFAEKKGYSKFGSYTGNGNADGPMIYTGFRPAWIMVRRSDSTGQWFMHDNKRVTFNVDNKYLAAQDAAGEQTFTALDMLAPGFKLRTSGTGYNASGGTYIYMAFAENPFINSNKVPVNAR